MHVPRFILQQDVMFQLMHLIIERFLLGNAKRTFCRAVMHWMKLTLFLLKYDG